MEDLTRSNRPRPTSEGVRRQMSRQRRSDTAPEVALRRELHSLGLRFRLQTRPLPDERVTADIVLGPPKIAVFVDGCFWHVCPEHRTLPRANASWWAEKLERNVARDRAADRALVAAGWLALRVWEHEDPAEAAARIAGLARRRRSVRKPI